MTYFVAADKNLTKQFFLQRTRLFPTGRDAQVYTSLQTKWDQTPMLHDHCRPY